MKLTDYILVKYDENKIKLDKSKTYQQETGMKPNGFWFSIDKENRDWKAFCESNDFGCLNVRNEYRFSKDANILVIDTKEKVYEFYEKYKTSFFGRFCYIDWEKVANDYDGIFFPEYFWDIRYDTNFLWYYALDCVSGCVWNLNAIEENEGLTNS